MDKSFKVNIAPLYSLHPSHQSATRLDWIGVDLLAGIVLIRFGLLAAAKNSCRFQTPVCSFDNYDIHSSNQNKMFHFCRNLCHIPVLSVVFAEISAIISSHFLGESVWRTESAWHPGCQDSTFLQA